MRSAPMRAARSASTLPMSGATTPGRTATPMPTRPIALGSGRAPREARLQLGLRFRPFADGHAVHHRVAQGAVAAHGVMAQDAVLPRAEPLDRALAREVEIVGAPADELRAQRLERVRHEEQLGARLDVRALPALGVPGVAD